MNEKIPPQKKGATTDVSSEIELPTEALAAEHFKTVKKRFFAMNSWELYAGTEKAEFSLRDQEGNILLENPKKGDYFCIKTPGLHNKTGDGYDWVQIEHLEEETGEHDECVYIRVRPCDNPTKPDENIAHFFDPEATSNFLIKRKGNRIIAEVHGRNETPNTQDLNLLEKVRNEIVALGGMLIASEFQWKALTDALVKYEE